jgi:hypothetical protein
VGELSYATHHQEESKNQPLAFIYIGGEWYARMESVQGQMLQEFPSTTPLGK